jgi:hypothetical protein
VAGVLLLLLAAGLVIVAVLAGVGSLLDHDPGAIGGGVFVLIFASVLAQAGRVVLRGGNRPPPSALTVATPMQVQEPIDMDPPAPAGPVGPAVDASVRYRERFCQFPLLRTLVALVAAAAAIALIAAIPGASDPGPQGFLFLLPTVPIIYLVGVVLYLPYGIRLDRGQLQLGVRGVPRVARVWRREDIPLDAVLSWQIGPSTTPSPNTSYSAERGRGRGRATRIRSTGDLRGPGVRQGLTVRVDPTRYRIRFPGTVMVGYTVQSSASIGYRDTGTVFIGTRRPQALARVLEAALPGRREPA